MTVTIYHNPACGTSRKTLALIREAGIEPVVIEYLQKPPGRAKLVQLIAATGQPVRAIVRSKEALFTILMNRPVVVSGDVVRLCRPQELVLEMLGNAGKRSAM
jgi:arsenate reductase